VAVKIKLKRLGKMRAPQYRIVVADARAKRDGRAIEEIGHYHPKEHPSFIEVDSPRVQYWLGVGAQPTEAVAVILKITGDWQKFKGLPGAEGTLQVAAPKVDKRAVFEAAAKESAGEPKAESITPRAKKAPKVEEKVTPTSAEVVEAPVEPAQVAEAPVEPAQVAEAPAEVAEVAEVVEVVEVVEVAEVAEAPAEVTEVADPAAETASAAPDVAEPEKA
jgi:small subunit ribosomal protein S16